MEGDRRERENRARRATLSPSPPGGTLILISLLAVAHLTTSDRSRCCLDCLSRGVMQAAVRHQGRGHANRERAQTTCTNAQRYIRGTQREIKSTASQEGTSSKTRRMRAQPILGKH